MLFLNYDFTPSYKLDWKKLYETDHGVDSSTSNGISQIDLVSDDDIFSGSSSTLYYTSDHKNWETVFQKQNVYLSSIGWCGDFYLAVGGRHKSEEELYQDGIYSGDDKPFLSRYWGAIYKSVDGKTWSEIDTGKNFDYFTGVASDGKITIIVDYIGNVFKSEDGTTFTKCFNINGTNTSSAQFINGKFYLQDLKGMIYSSTDTVQWDKTECNNHTIISSKGQLLEQTDKGILISNDFGKTYNEIFRCNSSELILDYYLEYGGKKLMILSNTDVSNKSTTVTIVFDGSRWQFANVNFSYIYKWFGNQCIIPYTADCIGDQLYIYGGDGSNSSAAYSIKLTP